MTLEELERKLNERKAEEKLRQQNFNAKLKEAKLSD